MWQWKAQTPGYSAFTRMSKPLTWRDHQRVGHVTLLGVEHEPVLGHHLEMEAVQVHRMDLGAVVRQVDQHLIAEVRDDAAASVGTSSMIVSSGWI